MREGEGLKPIGPIAMLLAEKAIAKAEGRGK